MQACNPSGGIKMMEHNPGFAWLDWWLQIAGLPTPS